MCRRHKYLLSTKNVTEIENVLNKEYTSLCNRFDDDKLAIHFGESKTKCIIFSRNKILLELSITFDSNRIKQYKVEYLGCFLDAKFSGESMGMKSLRKINTKLQFISRKNEFLNPKLCKLLCSSLIQPNFDYACIS